MPNNSLTSNKFYFSTVEDEFDCRNADMFRRRRDGGRSCPSWSHRVVAVAVLYVHMTGALTRGADRAGPSG